MKQDRNDDKDDEESLGALLREHATRHRASPSLQAGVRAEIALQSAAGTRHDKVRGWPSAVWKWLGTGFAGGAAVAAALMLLVGQAVDRRDLETELVSDHVRSLMVGHLTDVASTDQHTVKPWFQGKLDYSPPVNDFASSGFPLVGGRLEFTAGRPVAALVYKRRQHIVNVFVWPQAAARLPELATHQGFNVLAWRDGAMQCWAVSDVSAPELETLRRLWLEKAPAGDKRSD